MSAKRPTVEVDGEYLLNRLEAIERSIQDIRKAVAQGVFQPASPFVRVPSDTREADPREAGRPASPAGINIHAIDWRTRDNDDADDEDKWAWAHSHYRDGGVKDEARQLVEEIQRYGKVEVAGYEITLGGRDKKLLSRTKLK